MSASDDTVGLEIYVDGDKELASKFIDAAPELAEAVGVEAAPFEAQKDAGVRFFKYGCDARRDKVDWDRFIEWQMHAAVRLKEAIDKLNI